MIAEKTLSEARDMELIDELKTSNLFENVVNLPLSDAIRAGSSNSKQEAGSFGEGENMCALSAAWSAVQAWTD